LKEQANASRDERVVYSNLFNKIEQEIKHYEEIYKQTLIKNEVSLNKKQQQKHNNRPTTQEHELSDTQQFEE
jgi:hypothetical protein